MAWDRKERQEANLRQKIAVIVLERLSDPRLGFITITDASLSRDKRICTVSYTVLGSDNERRRTARALADAAPHVQELLSPTLRMRNMPELRFVYDETVERESRVLTILEELAAERAERGDTEGLDADDRSAGESEGSLPESSTDDTAEEEPPPSPESPPGPPDGGAPLPRS